MLTRQWARGNSKVTNTYAYDNASRFSVVGNNTNYTANYTYLANSPLVGQIVFKQSSTVRLTTTKQYDNLNRLTSIGSVPSADSPLLYGYQYNDANQRIRLNLADGAYWLYRYDSLGQVVSGKKYFVDNTPVSGQQFEYGFDDIGNRLSTKSGGDQNGANLQSATYSVNSLNQYTSRTVPGVVPVLGLATPAATVSLGLNGGAASTMTYRKGEYFWKETAVPNNSVAAYPSFNVTAVNGGSSATPVSGNVFLPKTPEVYDDLATPTVNEGYDLDGNQLRDGRWTYTWDAENRLIAMDSISGFPTGSGFRLRFGYDAKGRRITKTAEQWNGSAWVLQINSRFVYEGWNLLAELTSANAIIRTYVWGTDLSGSRQGAGGVGGLLFVNDASNGAHCVAYDGNGNGSALVSAAGGATTASYEYSPFGELIRSTGTLAKKNPFRFSTKYQDNESDLLYYGYRYFMPSTGRFLNADPIHDLAIKLALIRAGEWTKRAITKEYERYVFVGNEPLSRVDRLGLDAVQMVATTVIRPPDIEQGVKTKHVVVVNEYGKIISFTHYIGYTDLGIAAPTGGGALTESVSGSHPNFKVTLTGISWSAALGPVFSIDYTFTFDLNFCARTGVFNGDHDIYPSYTAQAAGKQFYDFNQTGSAFTGLPGIGGVTAGPVNFNFK